MTAAVLETPPVLASLLARVTVGVLLAVVGVVAVVELVGVVVVVVVVVGVATAFTPC